LSAAATVMLKSLKGRSNYTYLNKHLKASKVAVFRRFKDFIFWWKANRR